MVPARRLPVSTYGRSLDILQGWRPQIAKMFREKYKVLESVFVLWGGGVQTKTLSVSTWIFSETAQVKPLTLYYDVFHFSSDNYTIIYIM